LEDNTKVDIQGKQCEGVWRIRRAQDWANWRVLGNVLLDIPVPKMRSLD